MRRGRVENKSRDEAAQSEEDEAHRAHIRGVVESDNESFKGIASFFEAKLC